MRFCNSVTPNWFLLDMDGQCKVMSRLGYGNLSWLLWIRVFVCFVIQISTASLCLVDSQVPYFYSMCEKLILQQRNDKRMQVLFLPSAVGLLMSAQCTAVSSINGWHETRSRSRPAMSLLASRRPCSALFCFFPVLDFVPRKDKICAPLFLYIPVCCCSVAFKSMHA